ncbi:MAG: hypothetical protein H6564_19365 [Lewinellaceae bacterium]|nr:hypothetical protein [Lewinellaceae bacterium]
MKNIAITFSLLLLSIAPAFIHAQARDQLEITRKLLDQDRFKQAVLVAREAYRNGVRDGEIDIMAQALVLEARAISEDGANSERRRIMREVEKKLKEAYRFAEQAGQDSLLQEVAFWSQSLMDKPVPVPPPPVIPSEGGIADEGKPTLRSVVQNKLLEFSTHNDVVNKQLDELKLEKESLEKKYRSEIAALNLDQAQQELMLARKQQMIDSISMARLQDSLLVAQAQSDLQVQETQLTRQRNRLALLLVIAGAVIAIAGILLWLYFNSRRKNKIIEDERKRSEALLLNILPAAVAEELKINGKAPARHFKEVTVLFTDFKDFSRTASELAPQELVNALDECFRAFDEIVERHGLEKIKTIGDAYMCAGGLPQPNGSHASEVVAAGLEMQDWLSQAKDIPFAGARIGVHTGPVVAGVVGAKKFAYDIWGDTVNIAARMESAGQAGRVNLSRSTFELVKEQFSCSHRGKVPAKNIGEVDMYFVES